MKSLFTRILLALIVSIVLALLLASVLSRGALQSGFERFLEQQQERQLQYLVPELANFYLQRGGWGDLASDPRRWMRLLAQTRPEGVRPPEDAPAEFMRKPRSSPPRAAQREGAKQDVRHLWRRLFLLDQHGEWIAGARFDQGNAALAAIQVEGKTVGWIGFRAAEAELAPEARRFLDYQERALLWALLIALVLASGLGYLLARSLSGPVARLRDTVQELTRGHLFARAKVEGDDEIGELARHVNRLAETLEKNENARRRWTADIAHELRTPLAVLQGELDAVRDGVRPFAAATVTSLHEEVTHLVDLVEDLQTLALADAGALNIRRQAVDLTGLVRQALEVFAERMSAAGLALESKLPEQLQVPADPQRLRQLLHNLLENTRRYTTAGGKARVSLRADRTFAVLEIEDTGPGVDIEHRRQLFDRFYRAEPSRNRAAGGSGLGLAICRNIVEAHGGEISAADSPLGGLSIRVKLPLKV